MKCCNRDMKIHDSRYGNRIGVQFKRRRRHCVKCDSRVSTYEISSELFDQLISMRKNTEDIKTKLRDVFKIMSDI